jgi:hypothetical protein
MLDNPTPSGATGIAADTAPIILGSSVIKVIAVAKAILLIGPPISKPIIAPSKKPIRILTPLIDPPLASTQAKPFIKYPNGPLNKKKNGSINNDVPTTGINKIDQACLHTYLTLTLLNNLIKYPLANPIPIAANIPNDIS